MSTIPPPPPVSPASPHTPPANPAKPPRIEDNAGVRLMLPVGQSGWAIVASYLGLFSVLLLPAPFALTLSIIAISDIKKSRLTDRPKYGMGRAIFGLIAGAAGTLLLLAFLLLPLLAAIFEGK